ncbi:hypothetical protein [Arthrobacter sp. Cr_A7]|uniref:hypothetical protein n=1 Tax=Arthrobacter sp. Cr_A7 TaxID=3031017 RepID=UPI0023D9B939|nr:hypothetical protein [Arthrobacter sp. Cr_A7]MDF2052013.1 hypothetical protein [Arthrobacter sp. Cr_A7]
MDAETQRLVLTALISASSAVIGGLGGAVFTARTNRANTKDTLAGAQLLDAQKHLATLEAEHETWLRNKKQDVYFDFLALAEKRARTIWATSFSDVLEMDHEVAASRSKLKLVGTSDVRSAALDIERGLEDFAFAHKLTRLAYEALAEDTENEEAKGNAEKLVDECAVIYMGVTDHMVVYVDAVRRDIGSHSEDDEIINKRNQEDRNSRDNDDNSNFDGDKPSMPASTERELA